MTGPSNVSFDYVIWIKSESDLAGTTNLDFAIASEHLTDSCQDSLEYFSGAPKLHMLPTDALFASTDHCQEGNILTRQEQRD